MSGNAARKKRCVRCHAAGILVTSATPGDGRRAYACVNCKHRWTEGKAKGKGYR